MAVYKDPAQGAVPNTQVLDWETPDINRDKNLSDHSSNGRWLKHVPIVISSKLDRMMPSHRKYCGCSRRLFLIIGCLIFLVILTLAIGLGVGLSNGSRCALG